MSQAAKGRKPGRKPAPRTVTVTGTGDYADWECTARADFRSGWITALQSDQMGEIVPALEAIVLEHNWPGPDGPDGEPTIAETMADVDPYDGMRVMCNAIFRAIGALPSR